MSTKEEEQMSRILAVALLIALLAGCGPSLSDVAATGSGKLVSRSFNLSGFSKIDASHSAQVEVTRGDAYSVSVQVDDNLESRLEVSVTGDTLHIGLKNGAYNNVTLKAQVTMPRLTGVTLSGASTLRGELAGEQLVASLSGASQARLTGTAGDVKVEASGASQALLGDLAATNVEENESGASHVEVQANGSVTGEASGASTVTVSGSPTSVNVQTSGASQVITK
jgi:hypothetical protein